MIKHNFNGPQMSVYHFMCIRLILYPEPKTKKMNDDDDGLQ